MGLGMVIATAVWARGQARKGTSFGTGSFFRALGEKEGLLGGGSGEGKND